MSVSYKDAQKEKDDTTTDAKKLAAKQLKEAEKLKKKEEAQKRRELENIKKEEEKLKKKEIKQKEKEKKKINGKKLMALIAKDKFILSCLEEDLNKDDLIKKYKDELHLNLDLLAKFSKQEKINN